MSLICKICEWVGDASNIEMENYNKDFICPCCGMNNELAVLLSDEALISAYRHLIEAEGKYGKKRTSFLDFKEQYIKLTRVVSSI